MAYVTVPKDLTKVKNKVTFNLTKRQIVCMAIAAAFGIPFFFLTRDYLGITNAATGMVLLMVPAFLFGMYEKPHVRRYETENIYMQEEKTEEKGTHKTSARHKGVRLRNA